MRRISPAIAALSNLFGIGLGYVYVGRIRYAFTLLAVILFVLAFAGWFRLVFHPQLLYLVALVALLIGLFSIAHCALIASRNREVPSNPYNKGWVYLAWIVGSWGVTQGIIELRPVLFGYEAFRIPAVSMAPVLDRGDFIMVDTWRFDRADPAYGELVVFDSPGQFSVKYVKRVVGLPGDTMEIQGDALYRNGELVDESYIRLESTAPDRVRNFGPAVVPEDGYFMLGDNRHNSRDSRFFGSVPYELLHGRVEIRWFSYDGGVLWDRFPEKLSVDSK